jgi:F-type H+-transporting ATPase subunit b
VLLLWVPGESYAATADGEAGGYDWKTFGLAVLNFSILIAVLARVAAKPIRDFMYQRSVAIRRELERARSELAAARSEAAELRHRLDQMAHEAAEMLASAQQQAEAEAARACARAEETAERIRADAQRVAAVEVERARRMLREEAVALATGMASELLRERLTEADDARLVDEFIECAGANTH